MNVSGFVDDIELIEPLQSVGATSLSYVARIDGKQYFMKQLRPEYASELRYRSMFYKEYETGRRISDRHVVRYESIGENADGLYLLMEHINGLTLDEKVGSEPEWFASESNMEGFLIQLLSGLDALHACNVAYLDLNPRNIMFAQVSGEVKIVDLGFCFTDGYAHTAGRTLGFAAPELVEGRMGEIDARTDIYAVGRLMHYISERAGVKYSRRMERIMDRCLKEDKNARFESAKAMVNAIGQKRRMMRVAGALCAVAAIIAAVAGWRMFEGTAAHRQLMMYLQHDAEVAGVYYVVTSKDSATCMAIGRQLHLEADKETGAVCVYLSDKVKIGRKEYDLTKIADSAFCNSIDIESVSFPSTLREIGEYAFYRDSSLVYVNIPEGVVSIGGHSFDGTGIKGVKLPRSLRVIGNAAFAQNMHLKDIVVPEGVETLDVDAFGGCRGLQSVTLPSTLKRINRGVFWKCYALKEISIPAGCTTIGEYAFYHCDSLKHIYNHSLEPQNVPLIFNRKGITLHVPAASVDKYKAAAQWKECIVESL
jgi:hypothetical protein